MAVVLDAFISNISRMLLTMAQEEVGLLLRIPGEIEKLGRMVRDIRCVLSDAERRQSENQTISHWIMELKDIMYDADDVIDLCQIKAGEHTAKSGSSCLSLNYCLSNPVFSHKIGRRVKNLNHRLEGIVSRISLLGLIEQRVGSSVTNRSVSSVDRKTDPLFVQSDIVGEKIQEDTDALVELITKEDANVTGNMAVVAIVGIGGIGKTTLAKKVFNDQRIKDEFQVKIWVCVSKEVAERDLLKNVIREAGGNDSAAQERSELIPQLERLIFGKKFVLVLDDVWRESEKVWHGLLREPLMSGARGSRIIVTTRDQTIAMRMKAIHSHHVDKLGDDDAWSLLVKQVLLDGQQQEIENLRVIGFEIVKKCSGLPLAIKVVGGVLCTKNRTVNDWQAVLSSTLWSTTMLPNDIHAALYLSYEDLPPHLKQCFIYCSLYPEDWEFGCVDLIHLWHGQGFLEVDKSSFWESGLDYYKELVVRNLLEPNSNIFDQARCKMHDILWLLGRYLGKNECFVTREGQNFSSRSSLIKVRHLSIQEKQGDITTIKKQQSLRSLLLIKAPDRNLTDIFKPLCSLRVLDLSYSNISSLPDSFCLLIHLRYFSAGGSSIAMLPNAIGKLKNLEFLGLGGCENLRYIPDSVVNLVKLRIFNVYRTGVKGISAGLRKLSNLVELQGFKPDGSNGEVFSSLDELAPLKELNGLALENMKNVSNCTLARLADLNRKLHLKHLTFEYHGQNVAKETVEDVLNELSPPSCLEHLMIDGYYGCQLPNWLNIGTNLQNLRYLNLRYCIHFQLLALGYLPKLEFLYVKDAHSVVSVGTEFFGGNHMSSFPSLRRIIFEEVRNWKIWQWEKGLEAMPNLKELVIRDCPELCELAGSLSHHAAFLEHLEIIDAGKIKVIENFFSLKKLVIYDNSDLERVSNLPKLRTIWIRDCPSLKSLHDIADLRSMVLNVLGDSLPMYIQEIKMEKLTIWCNATLLQKIGKEGEVGSERQKFQHIQQANFYTENKSLYIEYRKEPFSLATNISNSSEVKIHSDAMANSSSCVEELWVGNSLSTSGK